MMVGGNCQKFFLYLDLVRVDQTSSIIEISFGMYILLYISFSIGYLDRWNIISKLWISKYYRLLFIILFIYLFFLTRQKNSFIITRYRILLLFLLGIWGLLLLIFLLFSAADRPKLSIQGMMRKLDKFQNSNYLFMFIYYII